jgi:hypothetical protein
MSESDTNLVRPTASAMQTHRQGFGEQAIERRSGAAVAMAERARAEIQAMHVMALQRPRDVLDFRVRLLDHCRRSGFAAAARYKKPIGGGSVEGASIRFVETALASYCNVLSESSITYEDDDQIQVRVTVRDLESTIAYADEAIIRKRVERRRLKQGQTALSQRLNSHGEVVFLVEATDDEVANAKAARQSKLLRNLGLRILPADVVDEAMELCKATMAAGAGKDPAGEQKRLTDAFHSIGVSPAQLAEYLGHALEQTQPAELVELREVYQTLRDGEGTWKAALAAKLADRVEPGAATSPESAAEPTPRGVAGAKAQLAKRRAVKDGSGQLAPHPAMELALAQARKEAAAAAAAQTTPDELETEVADIRTSFERILTNPQWMPGLRERVARLPPVERVAMELLAKEAEEELAAAKRQDDLPEGM